MFKNLKYPAWKSHSKIWGKIKNNVLFSWPVLQDFFPEFCPASQALYLPLFTDGWKGWSGDRLDSEAETAKGGASSKVADASTGGLCWESCWYWKDSSVMLKWVWSLPSHWLDYIMVGNKNLHTKSQQRHGHNHEEAGEKMRSICVDSE